MVGVILKVLWFVPVHLWCATDSYTHLNAFALAFSMCVLANFAAVKA
jgi:hypothetical protein